MKHAPRSGFLFVTALALGPMFVWAAHFGLVYLVDHMACTAFAASASAWARSAIVILTLAVLILLLVWLWRAPPALARIVPHEETGIFLAATVRLLAMLAILAVIWTGAASLLFPVCGGLR